LFWIFFWAFIGHIFAALVVYFNHRYIFHGKLSRYPLLKQLTKLHALHHAHAYTEKEDEHIFAPWWARIAIGTFMILSGIILNWWFAFGLFSFSMVYAYRHWRIHHGDNVSRFSIHHRLHHKGNPHKNLSGVYPVIDYIFGTAA
jgi:hypothetical protein